MDNGNTTNIGGRVQFRKRALGTENSSDWKIISRMARIFGCSAEYKDSFGVTEEIAAKVSAYADINKKSVQEAGKNRKSISCVAGKAQALPTVSQPKGGFKLRVSPYLFAQDKILSASTPLKHHFKTSAIYMHEKDAADLSMKTGDDVLVVSAGVSVKAKVVVSNQCNPGGVVLQRVSDEQGVMSLASSDGLVSWVQITR